MRKNISMTFSCLIRVGVSVVIRFASSYFEINAYWILKRKYNNTYYTYKKSGKIGSSNRIKRDMAIIVDSSCCWCCVEHYFAVKCW